MRRLIGVTILVAGVVLAVTVGQRMSTDAMAVAIGVVFGVAASIPTSLLVVAATRSRREEGYRPPRDELRPPPPAPQIYVVNPGTQPGQVAPRWRTDAVASRGLRAKVLAYADIDSFNTAPITIIDASTLPQRQVVNQ